MTKNQLEAELEKSAEVVRKLRWALQYAVDEYNRGPFANDRRQHAWFALAVHILNETKGITNNGKENQGPA